MFLISLMEYEGKQITWNDFFNLDLEINDDVETAASNWRECPTGERIFETLKSGTTIPQHLTKKVHKLAWKFRTHIMKNEKRKAYNIYCKIRNEKILLTKSNIWIKQLPSTSIQSLDFKHLYSSRI